jgi:tetratricopeptide (TPR) repeat protein
MLRYHNIDDLKGKVSPSILNMYKMDFKNLTLSSIIAGFHRSFGLKTEGNLMSLEIINTINDDTDKKKERNILIWNLYILSKEYMNDGLYDEALKIIERAEKNWSRDVILGDEIGVYHISWLEQILNKKAEICMCKGDTEKFEKITDIVILNRFNFFEKASLATGDTILYDRCTYNCFEIMAFESRKKNIEFAVKIIKQAIIHKGGLGLRESKSMREAYEKEKKGDLQKAFNLYLKYFYKLPEGSYDNIGFGYCKTCIYYEENKCRVWGICTETNKACSRWDKK